MKNIYMLTVLIVAGLFLAMASEADAQAAGNSFVNESFQATLRPENVPNSTHLNYAARINAAPVLTTTDSTMVLDVSAIMNVPADSYVAIFALEQLGPTADSATRIMQDRIDGFLEEMETHGVWENDVHIDVVSLMPMYSYRVEQKLYSHTFNEIPVGFTLRKNIHIGYTDPKVLEALVAAAARQEIYDIVKVEYIVENVATVYDSLRHTAIRQIKKRMKDFSELGVKISLDSPTILEGSGATMPIERYASFSAFGSTSIKASEAGRQNLYGNAEVNRADKPRTIYHNRIPFSGYDVVLNPGVVEPVVQFTYRLTVQYQLKEA